MTNIIRKLAMVTLALAAMSLAACSTTPEYHKAVAVPKGKAANYKVGNPYQVAGRWYYPKEDKYYNQVGIASWYGPQFHQLKTANGELFDMNELTAAHTTLPMPSFVRVTNLENGRQIILRINDRGPFVGDRIIDISRRGAQLLGFDMKGTARVRVEAVTPEEGAPLQVANAEPAHNPEDGPIMPAAPAPAVEKSQLAALPGDTTPQQTGPGDPGKVGPGEEVFVQAGAFTAYNNADKLAQSLKNYGEVTLSSIRVNGRNLFRVRIGPFKTMGEADTTLGKIVARGLNAARIVVD